MNVVVCDYVIIAGTQPGGFAGQRMTEQNHTIARTQRACVQWNLRVTLQPTSLSQKKTEHPAFSALMSRGRAKWQGVYWDWAHVHH